ncbi:MAG TPA: prepilin-type N-terminal cleavage/methylation domain-containing protein, partial [Burkholderiales bacterium]|nr:prepilin-type N-terminal cleavage/methylation domain-containing protein [Burkholderiales bacterium]
MKTSAPQHGLSLIELLVSMAIGLMLMAGLVTVFANSSQSQRELQRTAQQIENGRYAMDVLTQDLHHAGFYGRYAAYTAPASAPDPCITGDAAALASSMGFPVQGYVAASQSTRPSLAGTTCGTYLPNANLYPGSDVLVIRRADTSALAVGATAVSGEVYVQSGVSAVSVQFGNGAAITAASTADGGAASILQKSGAAESIRKYHVHIYFVAPCSIPSGGGSVCTGSSDDQGKPVPTLKRLELSVNSSGTLTFNTVPISEGVEALKIEYGIDNSPSTANASTQLIGDGAPDLYIPNATTSAPAATDFPNAVSAKV